MKNICDWNNCLEDGSYKAPLEKDNSKKYRMLCLKHVKEFNKNWNYFEGMDDDQIYEFIKSDMTWHKPTQSFNSSRPESTSSFVIKSSVKELTLAEYFREIKSSHPHLLLLPVTTPNSAPFSIK